MSDHLILDYTRINYRKLSREEEQETFAKYHKGDKEAFHTLVTSQIPLAIMIATKYTKRKHGQSASYLRDEYIQEAQLNLVFAVTKFNPKKGFRLSTYVTTSIANHLLNYGMENKLIRIPRSAHSGKSKNKFKITQALLSNDEQSPVPEPLYVPEALDKYELNLDLSSLTERQRQVIRGTFILDLKPKEIAKLMSMSNINVRSMKTRALEQLRKIYLTDPHSVL